jgi:hypothetical protein
MAKIKTKPERKPEPIDSAVISRFAREFADWRLNGCPGYGFADAFRAKVAKAARQAGATPSELFAYVHREAYAIIDAAAAR